MALNEVKLKSGAVVARLPQLGTKLHKRHPRHHTKAKLTCALSDFPTMQKLRAMTSDNFGTSISSMSDEDVLERIGLLVERGTLQLLQDVTNLGREQQFLAKTLYGEARGENRESKVAVAWSIRNRVKTGRWGCSYESVVTARLQFTCWSPTKDPKNYAAIQNPQEPGWRECLDVALEVLSADETANPLAGVTHYYSPKAQKALHKADPATYPETPKFAEPPAVLVPNPAHVPADSFRFYKHVR